MVKVMRIVRVAACIACLTATTARAHLPIVEVSPGIYRGPAPESAADYRQLSALGVKTVLDLRKFRTRKMDDSRRCVELHGMDYQQIPVAFRPKRDGSAECAFRALTNVGYYPIYIHCELGRDRVGLIVALYRVRCEGWSLCSAYAEMQRFGFNEKLRGLERYFWDCVRGGR